MKSSNHSKKEDMMTEHGRAIARGMEQIKVEKQKNINKAAKRRETMLSRAAEIALSGN